MQKTKSVRSNEMETGLSAPGEHAVLAFLVFSLAGVQQKGPDYEPDQQEMRGFFSYEISPHIPLLIATNSGAPGILGKHGTDSFLKDNWHNPCPIA